MGTNYSRQVRACKDGLLTIHSERENVARLTWLEANSQVFFLKSDIMRRERLLEAKSSFFCWRFVVWDLLFLTEMGLNHWS
jgi:hypothetical protein